MLDEHGMPHCRIHGQIPAPKRSKILLDFERTSDIRILLITLGTGAVGCAFTKLNAN
jgi:SNF2 family DNA or RNA helicase